MRINQDLRIAGAGWRAAGAFTLIEVLIAIRIFMMILVAIYSAWTAILKGTRAGTAAAADIQRARMAMRTIEDALLTAVNFTSNSRYYEFIAETSGDFAALTFVAKLPASFPGVGRYGDEIVRRVSFSVEDGAEGKQELILRQAPMLLDPDSSYEPYSLRLAKNVTFFALEFFDAQQEEWVAEWTLTNSLPKLVRVALGQGGKDGEAKPDVVTRTVALPAMAVGRELQMGGGARRTRGAGGGQDGDRTGGGTPSPDQNPSIPRPGGGGIRR